MTTPKWAKWSPGLRARDPAAYPALRPVCLPQAGAPPGGSQRSSGVPRPDRLPHTHPAPARWGLERTRRAPPAVERHAALQFRMSSSFVRATPGAGVMISISQMYLRECESQASKPLLTSEDTLVACP